MTMPLHMAIIALFLREGTVRSMAYGMTVNMTMLMCMRSSMCMLRCASRYPTKEA